MSQPPRSCPEQITIGAGGESQENPGEPGRGLASVTRTREASGTEPQNKTLAASALEDAVDAVELQALVLGGRHQARVVRQLRDEQSRVGRTDQALQTPDQRSQTPADRVTGSLLVADLERGVVEREVDG